MSEPQPGLEPPQHGLYMLFLLVLVFFLMGLVGFMICHVLKKKGYRCRTSRGSEPDDAQLQPPEDDDVNEDTVERIVRCIIQNEANAEALKEMLGDSEGEGTVQLSSVDATSSLQDGAPSHHHTVHLGSAAPCIHCSRSKRPPLVRQGRSKEGKGRPRPGETTVFSVGRFRVTHIEKRYGLHEHRDGSPTDRSWGSGGGQEPGVSQVAGGQPRTGTAAIERLLPEPPPSQAAATHPVQNGRLKDASLVPCTLEGTPGTSAELNVGTRGTGPSPGLPSQEANGQPTKLDTSGLSTTRSRGYVRRVSLSSRSASVFTVLMDYQQALPGDSQPGRLSPPLASSAPQSRDQLYFHLEMVLAEGPQEEPLALPGPSSFPFPHLPTGCLACLPQNLAPHARAWQLGPGPTLGGPLKQ